IRTEAESLRYAINHYQNEIRFCRYLPVEGIMIEIPSSIIVDHLKFLDGESEQSQATGYSKTLILKSLLKQLIKRLPKKAGDKAYFFFTKNKNLILKCLHQLKRVSDKIHSLRASLKSLLFRKVINKAHINAEI